MVRGQRGGGLGQAKESGTAAAKPRASGRQNTCVAGDAEPKPTGIAATSSPWGHKGFPCGRDSVYVHPVDPPDGLCIWCYYPHFTDEDTETRGVEPVAQGHIRKRRVLDLNPGLSILQPLLPPRCWLPEGPPSSPPSDKSSCLFRVSQGSVPAPLEGTPSSLACR